MSFNTDLNAKNEENLTPLGYSCRNGFLHISKFLIAKFSANKTESNESESELLVACYEGDHEVIFISNIIYIAETDSFV